MSDEGPYAGGIPATRRCGRPRCPREENHSHPAHAADWLREVAARALWDDAETDSDHDEHYSWDYLLERAATGQGDYAETRDRWYRTADAVLRALEDAWTPRWVVGAPSDDALPTEPGKIIVLPDVDDDMRDELALTLDRTARALAVLNGAPIPMGEVRARHAAAILRGDRG